MKKKIQKQWDSGDTYGSDIMGVGSYSICREDIKRIKKKPPIGFIRPKVSKQTRKK